MYAKRRKVGGRNMKLVYIYGPPASGKLTIARELSRITSYKVFHNHLTVDLVEAVIPPTNKNFWNYVNNFRYEMIFILVKEKINSIFTSVFDPRHPQNFNKIVKIVEKNKGKVYFVQLCPKKSVLLKRVKGKSRKEYGKLTSIKKMKESFKLFSIYAQFKHENHIQIDNSNISPKEVALQIKKHFKLK
jgi:chloramphenicol 3-O-phosphotransferase